MNNLNTRFIWTLLAVVAFIALILSFVAKHAASQSNNSSSTYSEELVRLSVVYRPPEYVIQQQILSYTLAKRANALRNKELGSCVDGVRRFLGNDGGGKIQGMAKYIETNSTEPEIGAVLITNEGNETCWTCGHASVVIGISGDTLTIFESNGSAGYNVAGIREINRNSPLIVGYLIYERGWYN